MSIQSFADEGTENIFHGVNTKAARRALPVQLWPNAQRKLVMLDAAESLAEDLNTPGNSLEKLRGDLAGMYSIRINSQYRIIFEFVDGSAYEVEITDYH